MATSKDRAAALAKKSGFPIYESEAPGRGGVLVGECPSPEYLDVFAAMGASRVEVLDTSSRLGDWSFLVKVRGQWRFACQEKRGQTYNYFISNEEVFGDPIGFELRPEIEAYLRERDPDYFFGRDDA